MYFSSIRIEKKKKNYICVEKGLRILFTEQFFFFHFKSTYEKTRQLDKKKATVSYMTANKSMRGEERGKRVEGGKEGEGIFGKGKKTSRSGEKLSYDVKCGG